MKVKRIEINGFKRFTKLVIDDLPDTAQLVVLVGPNGCGKSSLFDAMNSYVKWKVRGVRRLKEESEYFSKGFVSNEESTIPDFNQNVSVNFHEEIPSNFNWRKVLYVRSAYRHVRHIENVARIDEERHMTERVQRLIDLDQELSHNYSRLYSQAMMELFDTKIRSNKDIVDGLTLPVRNALKKVLPDLELLSLEASRDSGTFYFAKGVVERYVYNNLSGGERAAFDLLLDMSIKRDMYPNAIQCIDEPESHLGMSVQAKLLDAMFSFVPEESQLWIGTHSIGMLRRASEIAHEHPGKVAFINFYGKDFDKPQIINPITLPDRKFWREMHKVVLDDLATLVTPSTIILCESVKGFDADCYNAIFSSNYPDFQFASVGGKGTLDYVRIALGRTGIGSKFFTLRDRDQMNPKEIEEYKAKNGLVLSRVCIEEYLLDDEVLLAFCDKYGIADRFSEFQEIIPSDKKNLKAARAKIHSLAVKLLTNSQIGDNPESFMSGTLAPLITKDMEVYRELRDDIFGAIPNATPNSTS